VLGWLEDCKVIERIIQPNAHTEEIKEGIDIAKFLADHGRLDTKILDVLWDYSVVCDASHISLTH
jgi:hypothetical protein